MIKMRIRRPTALLWADEQVLPQQGGSVHPFEIQNVWISMKIRKSQDKIGSQSYLKKACSACYTADFLRRLSPFVYSEALRQNLL